MQPYINMCRFFHLKLFQQSSQSTKPICPNITVFLNSLFQLQVFRIILCISYTDAVFLCIFDFYAILLYFLYV